jgi:hypothetical protein
MAIRLSIQVNLTVSLCCALSALGACEEKTTARFHRSDKIRHSRNISVSSALDKRCALGSADTNVAALDERVISLFEEACARKVSIESLVDQCVRGNKHWVYCDGSVAAWPPEDWGPTEHAQMRDADP